MKKQLNILLLTMLILSQTILGPSATVFASDGNNTESSGAIEKESQEIIENEMEFFTDDTDEEATPPEVDEVENENPTEQEPEVDGEVPKEDEDLNLPEGNPDDITNPSEDDSEDSQQSTEDDSLEEENKTPEEIEKENAVNNQIPLSATEDVNLSDDVTLTFDKLVVNGTEIRNESDAESIIAVLGDKVKVFYSFKIEAKQDSGPGSYFTFDLPPSLLNFNQGGLNGVLTDDDVKLEYTTNEKKVTVKVIEGFLGEGSPFEGELDFHAEFSAEGADAGLDQELIIPIVGSDSITIPFTFKPSTTDQSMSKSGKPVIEGNGRYIEWEVWANREGALLNDAKLNDVTDGKHELEGEITIEKFAVGLAGVGGSLGTVSKNSFPIELENGKYAYKLTYKTIVTHIQQDVTEEFTNTVTLNNGEKELYASGKVSHKYGEKLEKTAIDKDKYKAKWQIAYNYFGSKVDSRTLTDTITGPHKVIPGSIKVYNVTVNASGEGEKGADTNLGSTATIHDSGKGFDITLNSPNGEAYLIEYETEYEKDFVIGGTNVENTVTDGPNRDSAGFGIAENIFTKTRGNIDFDNKVITWTLSVNVEKDMKSFIIEDTFTNYTEGGTRQTLLGEDDNQFTISNGIQPTSATVTDKTKGFKLEFGDLRKGTNFTVTYKTKFDILPNGTAYGAYENKANAKWNSPVDNKDYSVEKSAGYYPGDTSPTKNNGYKNGTFDHANQVFNWNVAVNINKQQINGSTLVDTIGDGHELVPRSIKIHKLILSDNDEGEKGEEVTTGFNLKEDSKKQFTLTFTDDTTDAYLLTYQTKDSDAIIGNDGTAIYANEAIFDTANNGEFPLSASVKVKHANELIKKNASPNGIEETITWKIEVNKSHSKLGEITLTDIMSDNQLILEETFEKREIKMNEEGTISYGEWEKVTIEKLADKNGFTLELGNLDKKGYEIRYKTFFLGGEGDKFSNKATINYLGEESGIDKDSGVTDKEFKFNDSSGTISSKKGKLELHKVGKNPATGSIVNLKGITFELWNKSGTIKIAEAVTDENGKLTIDNIRYGKYMLKEKGTPLEYIPLPENGIEIIMSKELNYNESEEFYIVENLEKVQSVKLTKTDAEDADKMLGGAVFKLYKNGIELPEEYTTNSNGEIVVEKLEPGTYYFKETKAPDNYILSANDSENQSDSFTINADTKDLIELIKTNKRGVGSLVITKQDAASNAVLSDTEFELRNSKGDVVGNENQVTNANGQITYTNLPYDTYTLKETKAKTGYVPNNQEYVIVVSDADVDGKVFTKTITNQKINRSVLLTKYNADKTLALPNAVFELRKMNSSLPEGYEVVTTFPSEKLITDENGRIYLEGLQPGEYQFVETQAPSGYYVNNEPVSFTITTYQTSTIPVEKTNNRIPDPVWPGPVEPGKPVDPDKPKPVEPGKPVDPNKPDPTDPTEPGKPGEEDPTDPTEPGKPGEEDPTDPTKPGKPGEEDPTNPSKPGKPGIDPTKPGNNGSVVGEGGSKVPGNTNKPGKGNKPSSGTVQSGGGSKNPNANASGKETLPQTGEQLYLYMTILGFVLILAGGFMVRRRKINE